VSYSSVIAALHESGHGVVAVLIGADVRGARLHEDGGMTHTAGTMAMQLRISLGGHAAETLLAPGEADVRCSRVDFETAYRHGINLARWEAHERQDREEIKPAEILIKRGLTRVSEYPKVQKLSAVAAMSEQEIAEGIARLVAGWTERAHELVAEAEIEVRELLSSHRVVVFAVAKALHAFGHLDGPQVTALIEGALDAERGRGRRRYYA